MLTVGSTLPVVAVRLISGVPAPVGRCTTISETFGLPAPVPMAHGMSML